MGKKIPIYFDTIILDSPSTEVAYNDLNGSRLKVAVFTKYKNRNGSYITDAYAEHLIKTATSGNTPVIGFFDPETQEWASHTGPLLANGYGYVEEFLGWEPLVDSDGETRDYAIFSVVLFTKYYEEAKKIRGQKQSMELDISTIQGDWAEFDGEEYFVYTNGDMLGLCVIGSHEPCFSVSSFFSAKEDLYKSQYEKFSSLLAELKAQVEEKKGGENPMDELTIQEQPMEEEVQNEEEVIVEETEPETEEQVEEVVPEEEETEEEEAPAEVEQEEQVDKFNELETRFNALQVNYEAAQQALQDMQKTVEETQQQITIFQNRIKEYEAEEAERELQNKNRLIEKYEKVLTNADEINTIKEKINDFSYVEIESKLAILFANQQMANKPEPEQVPLPEPAESQFALLMKKYRKN